MSKIKGGGTSKVCLPARKVASMSPAERKRVVNAKRAAASKGKRKRIVGKVTYKKDLKRKVTEEYLTACL